MLPGLQQDEENDKTGRDDGDHQESDNTGASLKVDYSVGEHTLTSITAYNEWNNRAGKTSIFRAATNPVTSRAVQCSLVGRRRPQLGLRVTGAAPGIPRRGNPRLPRRRLLLQSETTSVTSAFPKSPADRKHRWIDETEGYAAFGQADWHFTDATTLSLGLRYNYEEISAEVEDFKAGGVIAGADDDSVWLGKVSLQHQLQEDTMVYATVSTGYKGRRSTPPGSRKKRRKIRCSRRNR